MKRQRGFTLVEILIALGLSAIVSTAVLVMARGQLQAQSMNDEIMRAQANVRAGMDLLETIARRACGGTSLGQIGLNVSGVTTKLVSCVQVWDGGSNQLSGGTFTHDTNANVASQADALEVIYPISPPTVVTAQALPGSVTVADATTQVPIAVGDLLLVTDNSNGVLMTVSAIGTGTGTARQISFSTLSGSYTFPPTLDPSNLVAFRAKAVSIYRDSTAGSPTLGSLMLDPNGVAGTDHTDAQPLAEAVDDFQVAIGVDSNGDGIINETPTTPDEWTGNVAGELPTMAAPPWITTTAQPRLLRLSLMVKTNNTYVGASQPLAGATPTANGGMTALEDRAAYTYTGAAYPRWRTERITIAPRAWVLGN